MTKPYLLNDKLTLNPDLISQSQLYF